MLDLPTLYSFRRCPYAMRARLALYTAKVEHVHREVDLKNKPHEMLALSPKGTVPVLHLNDGCVLEQSLDIMKWAFGDQSLSTEDSDLIEENDTRFKYALDRYKYPGRYSQDEGVNYQEACLAFLTKLEARLTPYVTGNTSTFLDMAIFPFVRQFVNVDPEWFEAQPYPRLKVWLNSFLQSPLFEQIMVNHTPWSSADDPIVVNFPR